MESAMKSVILIVVLGLTAVCGFAQDPSCAEVTAAKTKTYGFRPTELDQKTRAAKSKAMDAFWSLVKAKGSAGTVCLKQLISGETKDPFFLFDGAALVLSLDHSDAAQAIVIGAVQRTDMHEVDPAGFLRLTLQLSSLGADIGPLAIEYLQQPNVVAQAPMHAMSFDRNMAAVLLFGSMRPELVDRYAIPALAGPDANLKTPAAIGLALNMTEASFKALQTPSFAALPLDVRQDLMAYRTCSPLPFAGEKPKFSREEVLKVIRRIPHNEQEFKAVSAEYQKVLEAMEKAEPKADARDTKAMAARMTKHMEEDEPYVSIAGAKQFLKSAVLTLGEPDLPEAAGGTAQVCHGVVGRNHV